MFSSSENELFSWTYLPKKTPQRPKILKSPVWDKILTIWDILFELIQIEVWCRKSYFEIFLPYKAGAVGNNIENEPQKPCTKLKKYVYVIFTENICSACNPMQLVVFCKNKLILCNNSNFLFEDRIKP